MYTFVNNSCRPGYQIITNMPISTVSDALGDGFVVVDSATWEPIDTTKYSNRWIAESFYEGLVDLVRKVS